MPWERPRTKYIYSDQTACQVCIHVCTYKHLHVHWCLCNSTLICAQEDDMCTMIQCVIVETLTDYGMPNFLSVLHFSKPYGNSTNLCFSSSLFCCTEPYRSDVEGLCPPSYQENLDPPLGGVYHLVVEGKSFEVIREHCPQVMERVRVCIRT